MHEVNFYSPEEGSHFNVLIWEPFIWSEEFREFVNASTGHNVFPGFSYVRASTEDFLQGYSEPDAERCIFIVKEDKGQGISEAITISSGFVEDDIVGALKVVDGGMGVCPGHIGGEASVI